MRSMDLEKISAVMSKFESQFEDLDVASTYYENATSDVTAVGTPQDAVDGLISQTAEENGLELSAGMLDTASVPSAESEGKQKEREKEEREDVLEGRLRALRNQGELAG